MPSKKKGESAWVRDLKKHPVMSACFVLMLCGMVYVVFFGKTRTPQEAATEKMVESSIVWFNNKATAFRSQLKATPLGAGTVRAESEAWWATLTPWQRESTITEAFSKCADKELKKDVFQPQVTPPPDIKVFAGSIIPDLSTAVKDVAAEAGSFWSLYDAYAKGREYEHMTGNVLENFAKQRFWGGMETFTEDEIKDLESRSFRSCRGAVLGRVLLTLTGVLKEKVAKAAKGEKLEWPAEPVPEPTWEETGTAAEVAHVQTEETFDEAVAAKSAALVMFYAPWCGHCKSFKPEFAKAAKALSEAEADVALLGVDLTLPANSKLKTRFDVAGFPTMFYFTNGAKSDMKFEAERTAFGVVDWLNAKERFNGALAEIAEPLRPPKVLTWAEEEPTAKVVHADDDTFDAAVASKTHALVMFYAPWCGHCKAFKPHFAKASNAIAEAAADAVLVGVDCTISTKLCAKFEVKGYPTTKFFTNGKAVSEYDGGRANAFDVLDWLNAEARLQGALTAVAEPLRPPKVLTWEEEGSAPAVVFADDKTFKSALADKKHALVMFYAPWCGHCKSFKPHFGTAASALEADNVNVSLVAVDATIATKVAKKFNVKGYPTIKFFTNSKEVADYDGARTHEGVLEWVKERATSKEEL